MKGIWAIILAAGESKRMGKPKLILPFRGSTIIESVIDNVGESEVGNTIIVLGADKEMILKAVKGKRVIKCFNDNYKSGMLSSLKCGLSSLPASFRAVLVFPGDQPLIGHDVINAVINAYKLSGKGIVIPVMGGKRGHPLLLDSKYRDEVLRIEPQEGLRMLAIKFSHDVLEVDVNNRNILYDVDTLADYQVALKQI